MDTLTRQKKAYAGSSRSKVDEEALAHLEPAIKQLVSLGSVYSAEEYQALLDLKRERDTSQQTRSTLFLALGLVMSLLFTIMAFEWKFYDDMSVTDLGVSDLNRFEETLEIPNTAQPPPPPPSNNQPPVIKEVEDEVILEEIKLNIDAEMTENTAVEEVVYVPEMEVEEEKAEEIWKQVSQHLYNVSKIYKMLCKEDNRRKSWK